jgi:hypothetical protein
MKIVRSTMETAQRPSDWFTGAVYIAMHQVDDEGGATTWGHHETDEEYSAAPEAGD